MAAAETGAPGGGPEAQHEQGSETTMASVFGQELVGSLTGDVVAQLEHRWAAFQKSLEEERVRYQKEDVTKGHKFFELEADLDLTRRRLEEKLAENESHAKDMQDLQARYNESRRKLDSMEETNNSLVVENGSLKRERDQLQAERSDLLELAERRQAEIDRQHKEWQKLSQELDEANKAKYEALLKTEEVESKEVTLRYREKRMEEEREFMEGQIQTLTKELRAKNDELINSSREQISKTVELQSKVATLTADIKLLEGREEALKDDNEQLQRRVEELSDKLRAARDSELRIEDNYRQELKAQTKLAELYKGHFDESEEKTKEMTKAIEELQGLLKQSSERYGALEDNFEKEKAEQKEELVRRNEAIRELKTELQNANDLIKTMKKKGLTAEGIENLSPSAAAASKLLKPGMTLTQVYSQLVSCQEELLTAKEEKERLNTYLDQILLEIEERAPVLRKQREEYDRAVHAVNSLSKQLEEARQEYEFRKREANECRQRASTVSRENQRLVKQVHDLGKQVTVLVNEVELARSGGVRDYNTSSQELDMSASSAGDSESVISDRLVAFKNINELQQRNIELLAVVRELSASHESSESKLVEEKTSQFKKELETASEHIRELREDRKKQEVLVESIVIERDMYKTMVEAAKADGSLKTVAPQAPAQRSSPSASLRSSSLNDFEQRAVAAEAALQELKTEFETYRKEKCENEKLINEDLQKAKEELSESRTKIIKLSSQEEYNSERFNVAQTNAQLFRKQVTLLEERSNKLNGIVAKHEQTIEILRNETVAAQNKLSEAEVQLAFLKKENDILKAAENRLTTENEILHRQKNSSSLVLENLNMIKLNLERSEEEKNMRLQNKVEVLEQEVTTLRRKLDEEQENLKQSLNTWESNRKQLSDKLQEAKENEKKLQEEKQGLAEKLQELQVQLTDAHEKLDLSDSTSAGVPKLHRQEGTPEASTKVRDLQLQLNQAKQEVTSLKEQLTSSRSASSQYKELADSAEKRLSENNNSAKALKDDLESRLNTALEEKNRLEKQLSDLKNQSDAAAQGGGENLKEALDSTKRNLEAISATLAASQATELELREDLQKQTALVSEAQERYQRELMAHAQDVETLNSLKLSASSHQSQMGDLLAAKQTSDQILERLRQESDATKESMKLENEKLLEQYQVVDQENASLHAQLATVSEQMASLQRRIDGDPDANRSFSEEESQSAAQLMQIIKFLRREKEILTSKVEVAQAEATRVKSQMDHMQKLLEESQAALKNERERIASKSMSAAKYDDLMQKVQAVSALNDSNKLLRDENSQLNTNLSETKEKLHKAEEQLKPLEEKLKQFQERAVKLNMDLSATRNEVHRWKARANQLTEKQQKTSPEELKRLQDDNSSMTMKLTRLQGQLKQAQGNASVLNNKVKVLEQSLEKVSSDLKAKDAEVIKLSQELQKHKTAVTNASNRLTALNTRHSDLESNYKKVVSERDALIESQNQHRAKATEVSALEEEIKSLRESVMAKENELTNVKKELAERNEQAATSKSQLGKVKTLARGFKEKIEQLDAELKAVKEDNAKKDDELKALKEASIGTPAAGPSNKSSVSSLEKEIAELRTDKEMADKLVEDAHTRLEELEQEIASLKNDETVTRLREEIEVLKKKEERFKAVLERLKREKEASHSTSDQHLKQEYESKMDALRAEKETAIAELKNDKQLLEQKVSLLEQANQRQLEEALSKPSTSSATKPSAETVTASVKPMSGSSAGAAGRKTSIQPQAHIQPTRHMPATATIRPQRGTTVMRPTTASSASELPQVSVQPTIVTVSPNASVVPPTSLNPSASEFIPRSSTTTSTLVEAQESSADDSTAAPRARIILRREHEGDPEPGPSTSAGPVSTLSVPPTHKRTRNGAEAEDDSSHRKRARTTGAIADSAGTTVSDEVEVLEQSDVESAEEDADEVMMEDEERGSEEDVVDDVEETDPLEGPNPDEEEVDLTIDDSQAGGEESNAPETVTEVDLGALDSQEEELIGTYDDAAPETERDSNLRIEADQPTAEGDEQVPEDSPETLSDSMAPAESSDLESRDDGVVPGASENVEEVPISAEESPYPASAAETLETVSQSEGTTRSLGAQGEMDRTSMDLSQLTDTEPSSSSSKVDDSVASSVTAPPGGPGTFSSGQQTSTLAGITIPVTSGPATATSTSEETASRPRQMRVTRTPIVWDQPAATGTSTQFQAQPGRGGLNIRGLPRGRASTKAKRSKGGFGRL